jgi:hypothetical protein
MNPFATILSEAAWPGLLAIGACLVTLPWLRRDDPFTRICIAVA